MIARKPKWSGLGVRRLQAKNKLLHRVPGQLQRYHHPTRVQARKKHRQPQKLIRQKARRFQRSPRALPMGQQLKPTRRKRRQRQSRVRRALVRLVVQPLCRRFPQGVQRPELKVRVPGSQAAMRLSRQNSGHIRQRCCQRRRQGRSCQETCCCL